MSNAPAASKVPERLAQAWRARAWPDDALARAVELGVRHNRILRWASDPRWTEERLAPALERRAALLSGAMRVREATPEDAEALVDLYAHSPQNVGAWEVTVERGPDPFAEFVLQEDAHITVLDHASVLLATFAVSKRLTFVGGRELQVLMPSALRVRDGCRGEGLGPLVQRATSWTEGASYFYRRERRKAGLRATVYNYPRRAFAGDASNIRLASPEDLPRCVELINRTHQGLDLFRPYDVEYLRGKLERSADVYGWNDFYVMEEEGTLVACAGLWDRGRHMRERWVHKKTGERHLVENTALLDFGCASGRDDAMASLIEYLIGVTDTLGRGQLMAPIEFLPGVVDLLRAYESAAETRPLYWQVNAALKKAAVLVTRPYTDLAYW